MIPQKLLGRAHTPDGTEVTLYQRGTEYTILADAKPLMTSRQHSSEEVLATYGAERAAKLPGARVLVGGLGMGYTLRSVLDMLPAKGTVVVAELLSEVVQWNREFLGGLAGAPLDDPRVTVHVGDVGALIENSPKGFDAMLLDVDNGPFAFAEKANMGLYCDRGLLSARAALRPHGVYAVWSAQDDDRFRARLARFGFEVERHSTRAHGSSGSRHVIWRGSLSAAPSAK